MNLDHVSPRTVRFWALIDTSVIALATPLTAGWFLDALFFFNGLLGFENQAPAFDTLAMFFVNLSGVLVAVWAFARLFHPVGLMALMDAFGRTAVALLIVWTILVRDAPPVLWFFVLTEGLGAVAQGLACRRR